MADNIKVDEGSGPAVSTEEITTLNGGVVSAQQAQRLIAAIRTGNGTAVDVTSGSPLPVADTAALAALEAIVSALAATIKVGDGSGALSVDGTVSVGNEPTVKPAGNVAHDAVDSGNPVKVGGKARTALVAVSAASDRADLSTDKFGRTFAIAAPLDQSVSGTLNRTNNTGAQVIAAPGASTAIVVTDILVVNAHATVGTKVSVRDGEGVKVTGYAGPVGGGFQLSNPDGLWVGTANTNITAICALTGADVDIFVAGYKIPA